VHFLSLQALQIRQRCKKKEGLRRYTPIPQKSARQKVIDRLSRLLKAVTLRRFHNRCVGPLTRHSPILDDSHIFPKGKYPLARFLVDNNVLQCRWCHEWYGENPDAGAEWIEYYLGIRKYRQLEQQVFNPDPMFRDFSKVEMYLKQQRTVRPNLGLNWRLR
jgi:hypothetical protein